MSISRNSLMAAAGGLLLIAAIVLGLWFFSGARATSDPAPRETVETTGAEPTVDGAPVDEPDDAASPSANESADDVVESDPTGDDDVHRTQAEPSQESSGELPPEYVTDTDAALADYVPYVGGTMDFGPEVSEIIAPACLPSSYADDNGTEMEYSCVSSSAAEIVHFGVFSSQVEADRALDGYLSIKPDVSYVLEQADADNWVILLGSEEALAVLEERGYKVLTLR